MSDATVLVVDDDDFIRDLTSSALRIAGFVTTMASGGLDALAAMERDHPDIVVLDVGLPGVDGFEVCRRLRAAGDQTPVVFLTAPPLRRAGRDTVSSTATCAGTPDGRWPCTRSPTRSASPPTTSGVRLRDGQTVAQVADANGTHPQDVIDALTTRATQRITKVVNGDTVRQRC
jgi:CheY-like chemotaxis protein